MELRTSADASEARGSCRDARGDDPYPYCRPDCQSSLSCPVEEMEALQLSCLYIGRLVVNLSLFIKVLLECQVLDAP